MQKGKIIVTATGSPLNPKTWSGTPFNLSRELQKLNLFEDGINAIFDMNYSLKKIASMYSRITYSSPQYENRSKIFRLYNSTRLNNILKKYKAPYVLHTSTLYLPFFTKFSNKKHFLFIDSTWNLWSSNLINKNYSLKLSKDSEALEKKSYDQMSHIFSISEYVKNNLIEHYKISEEKITVVGSGRGVINAYCGQKNYSNKKILFVAKERFEDKGGNLLLEAFENALCIDPELNLTILGQEYYKSFIKTKNTKVYGFLPLEELQKVFEESSVFVLPAFNEPWGLVFLEALSCKMPIIGLERNSFPEINQFGRFGYSLTKPDANELANLLVNAFKRPETLKKMGEEGQDFCLNKFTWEKTVKTIIDRIYS